MLKKYCLDIMSGQGEFWPDKWAKWPEIGQWPATNFQLWDTKPDHPCSCMHVRGTDGVYIGEVFQGITISDSSFGCHKHLRSNHIWSLAAGGYASNRAKSANSMWTSYNHSC